VRNRLVFPRETHERKKRGEGNIDDVEELGRKRLIPTAKTVTSILRAHLASGRRDCTFSVEASKDEELWIHIYFLETRES